MYLKKKTNIFIIIIKKLFSLTKTNVNVTKKDRNFNTTIMEKELFVTYKTIKLNIIFIIFYANIFTFHTHF